MRVLVVEDDPLLRKVILRVFRKNHDAEFFAAESARDAITLLQQHTFDAVVSDFDLTGPSHGGNLLEWIRANMPRLESRFMFLSGNDRARAYGVRYIDKACELRVVSETLAQMLAT